MSALTSLVRAEKSVSCGALALRVGRRARADAGRSPAVVARVADVVAACARLVHEPAHLVALTRGELGHVAIGGPVRRRCAVVGILAVVVEKAHGPLLSDTGWNHQRTPGGRFEQQTPSGVRVCYTIYVYLSIKYCSNVNIPLRVGS